MSFVDTQNILFSGSTADNQLAQIGSAVSLGKAMAGGAASDVASEAIELLSGDNPEVQQMLAFELRLVQDLPEQVVVTIAKNDDAAVSVPFLEVSPAVTEDLILSIVDELNGSAQSAVARRPDVTDAVADALMERGNEKVALCLARNDKAAISETVLERIVAKFPNDARILKSTDVALSRAKTAQIPQPSETELPFNVLVSRARAFQKNGMLTSSYIVDLIEKKSFSEFEAALSAMTGHSRKDVRALVLHSDATLVRLEQLCKLAPGVLVGNVAQIKEHYASRSA